MGESAQHGGDHDLALQPSEGGADAEVQSFPEREVTIVVAVDVEPIRFVECLRVAICRVQQEPNGFPRLIGQNLRLPIPFGCVLSLVGAGFSLRRVSPMLPNSREIRRRTNEPEHLG